MIIKQKEFKVLVQQHLILIMKNCFMLIKIMIYIYQTLLTIKLFNYLIIKIKKKIKKKM